MVRAGVADVVDHEVRDALAGKGLPTRVGAAKCEVAGFEPGKHADGCEARR
jgi:hypothetical protein